MANLSGCWSRATSNDPHGWSPDNPQWGQCAVTALVVQDAVGGELVAGWVNGKRHYWNRHEGDDIDFTIVQFGDPPYDAVVEGVKTREYVLSNPDTRRRYEELKACMEGK